MIDLTPCLKLIHAAYVLHTGRVDERLTIDKIWPWECWLNNQWTEADLVLVIRHVKRKNLGYKEGFKISLSFRRLIQDCERFGELLADARAAARVPYTDPNRAQVLRATGRPVREVKENVQSAGEVVGRVMAPIDKAAHEAALASMAELKKQLQ